ncbi:Elicitin [Phytophthora infestans]|uniref:Elicitin n=1 Tax=Phytophthora infestans TaxID=4787 RepID=A0A8S9TK44_PHYIN|nr:Elicitin [Phytophthora infestans]
MEITFATILLLHAAVYFGGVAAASCDTTALSKLLMNENVKTCRGDSGYNAASMTAATDAQVNAVCNSNACTEAMKALREVAPDECTIGPIRLYADIIDPLERRCGRKSGSLGAGSAVNASAPGSGPSVGDGDSPTTTKPPTKTPASPRTSPPSTTPANGGTATFTLSVFGTIIVLATVVAAVL